ncbi:MAG: beta-glucosidase, partial [Candidatus Eisenbacteria bacterium]|nr:beta-glucosidase [Candidatus Eisenbacteria bacterium]
MTTERIARRRRTPRAAFLAGLLACVVAASGACTSPRPPAAERPAARVEQGLSDAQLVDRVQRQTFRYFWDFGHPVSGLARDRSNSTDPEGHDVCTSGGTGFGVMAIVVAAERGWVGRAEALERLLRMTAFLQKSERHRGVFPHWLNGATGRTIAFGDDDDGGDIVETAYLMQGLLTARQYFAGADSSEAELRRRIDALWREVEWTWHVAPGEPALMWNRSPRSGFAVGAGVSGWNEALITYVLAASSPTHPIDTTLYHRGWARDGAMVNGREYFGIRLPLGPGFGGPLFFEHYSFLGLDPRGLEDRYASYWEQCVNHTLINREHCVRNPKRFRGYGTGAWGLTASDVEGGYAANSPAEDTGVITPSAALSSFPYTPRYSMQALRHFHDELGGRLWSEYGFVDAYNESGNWTAASHLAIDQGPIVVMIENYRTRLPWKLFMS